MDTVDSSIRSKIMAKIRHQNTKPERRLAGAMAAKGLHFHKWSTLPGKPDMVLKRAPIAIFVDGCFWHVHESHFKMPKSNIEFWRHKLKANKLRDIEVDDTLIKLGYRPLRFWECEINANLQACIARINGQIS